MKKLIFILLMCTSCTINTSPGEGTKVGRIVKLEKVGLLSKTWEGELIRGGLSDGSGSMGGTFYFTIEDDDNVARALNALYNQTEVSLFYKSELFSSFFRSEKTQPHFVVCIQENK
jgi:hypothetical protein